MTTKLFELRDKATFIPVIAIQVISDAPLTPQEYYLLSRAGYGPASDCVILIRAECAGIDRNATYDPYSWGSARTFPVAHLHIIKHWDELKSGDVIDVEFILGETTAPKTSERTTEFK
jgi:hypothetical protein